MELLDRSSRLSFADLSNCVRLAPGTIRAGLSRATDLPRADPIIPFGLASMIIQAVVFSWAFPRIFPAPRRSVVRDGLLYGIAIGLLSWSFTTLAVAAKHPMASISDFFLLETAFTVVQFVIVGPLIALAHRN
jgi:hypothetical protein